MGAAVARRGWGLVYGGARVGLMTAVADAALGAGGEVIGVIPGDMVDREVAHPALTELVVVESMHERKATMHARSDAFVALPGGFGTLDESFEAITWRQLGLHAKAFAFLDVDGYWQPLIRWIDRAVADGFVDAAFVRGLRVESDVERLLDGLGLPPGPGRSFVRG
jgi:uncharacterized protein (TIGR00730 family)